MNDLGKVVASIEARMTSSRLPGKVLMPVPEKSILFYLIERLKSIAKIDKIEDFKLIKLISENLYPLSPLFSCQDIMEFLQKNPDLAQINESVKRKGNT